MWRRVWPGKGPRWSHPPSGSSSRRADLEQLAAWADGGLVIPIDSTFPVKDVGQALARQAQGGMKGRVVITVEGGF